MRQQTTTQKKQNFVEALKKVFASSIGYENRISRAQLFRLIFGNPNKYDRYELWWLWTSLKRGMNYLRKNTYYFIVPTRHENDWAFYIPKTEADTETYQALLDDHIQKTKEMQQKCKKAVREKYWQKIQKENEERE